LQHIGLTLKCEQMDNLGRDEVLINGSSRFCVLGSTGVGMELEKKVDLSPSVNYLNIQGNEAFVVADLNPDTATMNFNKEVVLLLSNQDAYQQMYKTADVPSFEILMLDTISADTVAFLPFALPERTLTVSPFLTCSFGCLFFFLSILKDFRGQ